MITILAAARRNSIPVLTILGLIGIWQFLVMLFNVPSWLLPSPVTIWAVFLKDASMLGRHIVATGVGAVGGLAIPTPPWPRCTMTPSCRIRARCATSPTSSVPSES